MKKTIDNTRAFCAISDLYLGNLSAVDFADKLNTILNCPYDQTLNVSVFCKDTNSKKLLTIEKKLGIFRSEIIVKI